MIPVIAILKAQNILSILKFMFHQYAGYGKNHNLKSVTIIEILCSSQDSSTSCLSIHTTVLLSVMTHSWLLSGKGEKWITKPYSTEPITFCCLCKTKQNKTKIFQTYWRRIIIDQEGRNWFLSIWMWCHCNTIILVASSSNSFQNWSLASSTGIYIDFALANRFLA